MFTKFCSNHEIFTTKIKIFANLERFTKFLCHENLELEVYIIIYIFCLFVYLFILIVLFFIFNYFLSIFIFHVVIYLFCT